MKTDGDSKQPRERLLYTVDEACALLGGLARSYVYELLKHGVIHSVKVGRRRMIARRDLEEYVEHLREVGSVVVRRREGVTGGDSE